MTSSPTITRAPAAVAQCDTCGDGITLADATADWAHAVNPGAWRGHFPEPAPGTANPARLAVEL